MAYNDDPSRLDDPLDLDEVNALLAGNIKSFGRDTRKVTHFLQRTVVTIQEFRRQLTLLHRDVQQAQLRASQVGRPTTMDPATAAQYLTMEQVVERFDQHMVERLETQKRIERELRDARAEAVRRVNAVRFVAHGIFDDPDIPDTVKAKLHAALVILPDEPAEQVEDTATGTPPPPPAAASSLPSPQGVPDSPTDTHPPSGVSSVFAPPQVESQRSDGRPEEETVDRLFD